jgi:hypothetical protein
MGTDILKDLNSILHYIVAQPLEIYNEHTYDYSSGYRRCARDILALVNAENKEKSAVQ